jgi:hypothetical protein
MMDPKRSFRLPELTVVPDDHVYTRWRLDLIARLATTCPYCGAQPCRPCRTLRGRIPGRITPGPCHDDRYQVAAAVAQGEAPAKPPATTCTAAPGHHRVRRVWLR